MAVPCIDSSLNDWHNVLQLQSVEVVLHDKLQQEFHFVNKHAGRLEENGEELVHDAGRGRGGGGRGWRGGGEKAKGSVHIALFLALSLYIPSPNQNMPIPNVT